MTQTNQFNHSFIKQRADEAWDRLHACSLCPHQCGVNRLQGEKGKCRTGEKAIVSSAFSHHGEERCISGTMGSGTIFFSMCNLNCVFCQNYTLSQYGEGRELETDQIAQAMMALQREGCHNINWVSPTHVVPQILEALASAVNQGLHLPLVYNSGGYDSLQTLQFLDGIVDIYMPDFKYCDTKSAETFSGVADYPQVAKEALREMHRQTGDLKIHSGGVAERGVLVRHLVLPDDVAGSKAILEFLASEISPNTAVNVMGQYRPCYRAHEYDDIRRAVYVSEVAEVQRYAHELGLRLV